MNESKSQATLGCSQTGSIAVSKLLLQDQMNLQQLTAKTEIIQALHVVESNQSFWSTDKDSERFREQFPYCKIAAGYSMHADKTRYIIVYIIVYGIAPFVKDFIIHDAKGKFFTYKFDKTTTSKVEKQYDGYITHFSNFFKQVITTYSGSLFVRHCTSKDLLHHFHSFIDLLDLSTSWLLNIGMDGPTVNTSFLNQQKSEMEESHQSFIDIGACQLHITNNSFRAILNVLKPVFDLDQVATDLHFFFKRFAARRDYKVVENIIEITTHYMKKHVESRWLSIDRSLVQILEQIENLR